MATRNRLESTRQRAGRPYICERATLVLREHARVHGSEFVIENIQVRLFVEAQ